MHRDAVEKEALLKQSRRHYGGLARAFEKQITLPRQAVVGAMKMYWLAKEMAHTTKYESVGSSHRPWV